MLKYIMWLSLQREKQDMDMFPLFTLAFAVIFILAIISIIVGIVQSIRKSQRQLTFENQQVREREIVREIVKIRCSYCGNLYDEKYDKCPHCGGKKS